MIYKVRNLKVEKLQFLYPSMTMCNSYSSFQQKKGCAVAKSSPDSIAEEISTRGPLQIRSCAAGRKASACSLQHLVG